MENYISYFNYFYQIISIEKQFLNIIFSFYQVLFDSQYIFSEEVNMENTGYKVIITDENGNVKVC